MRTKNLFFTNYDAPRWWVVALIIGFLGIVFWGAFGPIINEDMEKRAEFYQNMTVADKAHVANIRKKLEANPPAGSLIVWEKGGMYVIHTPTQQGALVTYWRSSFGSTGYQNFYQDVDDFTLFNIKWIILPNDPVYGAFAYKLLSGL